MRGFTKVIAILLVLLWVPGLCYADFTYPQYTGANQGEAAIDERINIVFDNSGHDEVKDMLIDIVKAAAVAENTAIWIYPVAGSAEPIRVVAGKDFANNYFTTYAKSSNEFKAENMVEKAREDLLNDNTVTTKRLILYADNETAQLRTEYDLYDGFKPYFENTPDVTFTVMYSSGSILDKHYLTYNEAVLYDYMSTRGLCEFLLAKNGYSLCDSVYNQEQGILKLEKGKADNNVFVMATNKNLYFYNDEETADLYLGGCMMGTKAYESYAKSNKVNGVALSYHHTLLETNDGKDAIAFALFTADGTTVNPLGDDVYIPLLNASDVSVYHRSTKGVGVCSAETTYNASQDKKIVNASAPKEEESEDKKNISAALSTEKNPFKTKETQSVPQKILAVVLSVLGTIFRILGIIIRLAIFAFIILLIASRKFRSYIQLKILNTKFGPLYEKTLIKIKKIISDIAGAGAKIRGNADLKGDYIFISKASADMGLPNNRITLLIRELESRGIACWLSETGIKAGEDYNVILPQAIRGCTLFLLFVSPMSVKSSDVVSEIGTAKEHKKNIIPVQIEPFDLFKDFPNWAYMLKQYQKTDLFTSKQEDIKSLADQIESTYNALKK